MADKSTIDAYNKIADDFHQRNSAPLYGNQYQLFASHLKPGSSILDIGCGTGRDAGELIKLDLQYTGVDASEGMIAIARDKIKEGVFQIADFCKFNFPDNTFDGFWAAASLLHVPKMISASFYKKSRESSKRTGSASFHLNKKLFLTKDT